MGKTAVTDEWCLSLVLSAMRWDGLQVKHRVLPAKEKLAGFLWVCDSPARKEL